MDRVDTDNKISKFIFLNQICRFSIMISDFFFLNLEIILLFSFSYSRFKYDEKYQDDLHPQHYISHHLSHLSAKIQNY